LGPGAIRGLFFLDPLESGAQGLDEENIEAPFALFQIALNDCAGATTFAGGIAEVAAGAPVQVATQAPLVSGDLSNRNEKKNSSS
jgi:hypothetical protein